MPRHAETIAEVIYKGIYWVFGRFFADALRRQTEKFWNRLGIANVLSTWISKAELLICKSVVQQIRVNLR